MSVRFKVSSALVWYAIAILILTTPFLGRLEGIVAPVVDYRKTFFTNIEEDADGDSTTVSGLFRKGRDCAFQTMEFFQRDGTRIPSRRNGYIPSNRPGRLSFGPWVVEAPKKVVLCESYVISEHSCWPYPLWNTYSLFYNGALSQDPMCDAP